MKRILTVFILILFLCGCAPASPPAQIAATTLPVYEFTARLCEGTGITVTRLVTEEVSCLHDYSLNVRQVKAAEAAEHIVISGAGLEEFMHDLLHDRAVIDASAPKKNTTTTMTTRGTTMKATPTSGSPPPMRKPWPGTSARGWPAPIRPTPTLSLPIWML